MPKKTPLWLLGGLALLALASSAFTVAEGEAAIVYRLGAPRKVIQDAGLHFKWPAPIDSLARVDLRVHLLDPTPGDYLTGDRRNVIVDAFVAWRVADPETFLVRLRSLSSAEQNLTSLLKSAVATVLNSGPLADLVSIEARARNLDKVAAELADEVRRRVAADDSGIVVELAGIKRINFPESNKNAVFDWMRSEREAEAEEFLSRGRTDASAIRAEADLAFTARLTEANVEASTVRGAATAEATGLLAEARERHPELFEYLRTLELFAAAQGDVEFVLTSDSPLLRIFDPAHGPALERTPPPAPSEGKRE